MWFCCTVLPWFTQMNKQNSKPWMSPGTTKRLNYLNVWNVFYKPQKYGTNEWTLKLDCQCSGSVLTAWPWRVMNHSVPQLAFWNEDYSIILVCWMMSWEWGPLNVISGFLRGRESWADTHLLCLSYDALCLFINQQVLLSGEQLSLTSPWALPRPELWVKHIFLLFVHSLVSGILLYVITKVKLEYQLV